MRTVALTIASLLIATPAVAAQTSAKAGSATKASEGAQERKYCIQYEPIVGSRVAARKACKTKAEWARDGIDVEGRQAR